MVGCTSIVWVLGVTVTSWPGCRWLSSQSNLSLVN